MKRKPCRVQYFYTGGSLTRTSERYSAEALSRTEALQMVDAPYQLRVLEAKACKRGKAAALVSFGGKLIVKKRRA